MLQLTKSFGPMLRIILSMIGEVMRFLFIWTVVLICISSVSSLLFGTLEEYSSFIDVVFVIFGTSLGSYDNSVFNELSYGKIVGESFITVAVLINNIVLLNFIIAILADTYSKLANDSLGIYYDGIIARIPIYEDDDRYGGLIVGTPPFNMLSIIMIPFYMLVKDESKLRNANDLLVKVMFAPIALCILALFMVLNLVYLPFAYLTAIYKKIKLIRQKSHVHSDLLPKSVRQEMSNSTWSDLVFFIIFGVILLLLA